MKQVSQALKDTITCALGFQFAPVWTFYFDSGVKRWTSVNHSVSYGGNTWTAGEAYLSKGRILTVVGTDPVSLTVNLAGNFTVGGASLTAAAAGTTFRGIRVVLERLIFDANGTAAGLLPIFDGTVTNVNPSTGYVELVVKGSMAQAVTRKGTRSICIMCPFTVYDSDCGATPVDAAATVASGSTASRVYLTSMPATADAGAQITFTSGPLNGVRVVIRSIGANYVDLYRPVGTAPTAGTTATIRLGCMKTREYCRTKHNNIARCGACPNQPEKSLTNG